MRELFLSAILILSGCASLGPRSADRFPILKDDQSPIPISPKLAGNKATFRQTTKVVRLNSMESSTDNTSILKTVEALPNFQKKVTISIESFKGEVKKGGKSFSLDGDKIFAGKELTLKLDCISQKVIEKHGFQEALDRIDQASENEIQKDAYVYAVVNFVEQAPDLCKDSIGPFTGKSFIGKVPGQTWSEKVPLKSFGGSPLESKFLGWHQENGRKFAVLHGNSKDQTDSEGAHVSFRIETYLLLSSDWQMTRTIAKSEIATSAPGEKSISGTMDIDILAEPVTDR
jgi:hypothetical protein